MRSKYGFETTAARSVLMSKIKSVNVKSEILLAKSLWKNGIRYRKNTKTLVGCPDFSIKKYRIVIFIDGEFWHGFNWAQKKNKIKSNREYWINKIERNIARDKEVNTYYSTANWLIFRLWEQQVIKKSDEIVELIKLEINIRSSTHPDTWVSGIKALD